MSLDVLRQVRGQPSVRIGRFCMSDAWHARDEALLDAREDGLPVDAEGFIVSPGTKAHRRQWREAQRARDALCKVYPGEESGKLLEWLAGDLDGDHRWFDAAALDEPWDWLWISW